MRCANSRCARLTTCRTAADGLTDVEVEWPEGAEADAWPKALPDLHAGEPLLVLGAVAVLLMPLAVRGG